MKKCLIKTILGSASISLLTLPLIGCSQSGNTGHQIKVESIEIIGESTVTVGFSSQLTVKVLPVNATNQSVTWWVNCDTPGAIEFDKATGKINAIAECNVSFMATSNDGSKISSKTFNMKVVPVQLVESIEISGSDVVFTGRTSKLSATVLPENATNKNLWWFSTNSDVAIVDRESGFITAKSVGNTTIYAVALDGSGVTKAFNMEVKATSAAIGYIVLGEGNNAFFDDLIGTNLCSDNPDDDIIIESVAYKRDEFNYEIVLRESSEINAIPDYFLKNCTTFNKKITLSSKIKQIGNDFLSNCKEFNQELTLSNVETIGNNFLKATDKFNNGGKDLKFDNISSIGENFLESCPEFYKNIVFGDDVKIKSIPNNFMMNCIKFNHAIRLPSTIQSIGDNYFRGCIELNESQDFSNLADLKTIGENFMMNCKKFTQQFKFPKSESTSTKTIKIGSYFMRDCTSFDSTIDMNDTGGTRWYIGSCFMYGCTKFNKPITLPTHVKEIDSFFLAECKSFNQEILIGEDIIEIHDHFMYNAESMTSTIKISKNVSNPADIFSSLSGGEYSFATNNQQALIYQNGIKIEWLGHEDEELQEFFRKFPDSDVIPYRKWNREAYRINN